MSSALSDPSGATRSASRPYVTITADTHAGASIDAYRAYLDPQWRDEFDAWRAAYRNPAKKHIGGKKTKNWDSHERRADLERDGVAAEILFPNTVPPFYDTAFHIAPPPTPEQYPRWLAGIRAHNRWLADFCAEEPERRAGIGLIHLNDIDDAIEDVRWIKEHGLRGGILLPTIPPDVDWVKPLNHPDYDRLWAVCQDLEVPINCHGGTGSPSYARVPSSALIMLAEIPMYSRRPLLFLMLSGVFERFPRLRFVMTEQGCSWLPGMLQQLDMILENVRENQAVGELRFKPEHILPKSATEYVEQNVWFGISFPQRADVEVARSGIVSLDKFMWGSDYPHDEGTYPYTREALRQVFSDWPEEDLRKILGENAAELYDFDLDALAPLAAQLGPRVSEVATPLTELPPEPNEALLRNATPSAA